ncbi:MAG: DivIVA domain-containing protein [Faecalibacterium sp.]|nr:DivIVA domain-containing protein [Ruminococcus sp.]MCM1391262.1 DivIVA domain-containing protein [Ruminococcus sp.]MCM1484764.1 DivIVA domain-containing protein [Faecalibacterium sp.]
MANINFTVAENGYDCQEVDKYIEMLQQEYKNAIAWGEEMEAKLEELKASMEELGVYFTIDENNQNEVIEKVFNELTATVNKVKQDAEKKCSEIIAKANEKGRSIVKGAMENSVELRTQNDRIMKNLKSISDMIGVILDKAAL